MRYIHTQTLSVSLHVIRILKDPRWWVANGNGGVVLDWRRDDRLPKLLAPRYIYEPLDDILSSTSVAAEYVEPLGPQIGQCECESESATWIMAGVNSNKKIFTTIAYRPPHAARTTFAVMHLVNRWCIFVCESGPKIAYRVYIYIQIFDRHTSIGSLCKGHRIMGAKYVGGGGNEMGS